MAGNAQQDRPPFQGAAPRLGLGLAHRLRGLVLGQVGPANGPHALATTFVCGLARFSPSRIRAWLS